jgi:hypothetical protein
LIVCGLLYSVVDENVGFFQKYAPKFNASIHRGEITSKGDADYHANKWREDLTKLNEDVTGSDWKAMREEVLKRKPFLADLVLENDKWQRRMQLEANQHLDANDPCETLAIHEGAPLMARYTRIEQDFYSLVARTETATEETSARLDEFNAKKAELDKRSSDLLDDMRAKNCK